MTNKWPFGVLPFHDSVFSERIVAIGQGVMVLNSKRVDSD